MSDPSGPNPANQPVELGAIASSALTDPQAALLAAAIYANGAGLASDSMLDMANKFLDWLDPEALS